MAGIYGLEVNVQDC